jgi:hypothetical protein
MKVEPIMNFLVNLLQEKLHLAASFKVIGVLLLVAAFLWAVNVLVHARDKPSERSVK